MSSLVAAFSLFAAEKVQFTENERSKCERWKMKDFDWIAGQMCRHGSFLSTLNCSICIILVVVVVVVERKKSASEILNKIWRKGGRLLNIDWQWKRKTVILL